MRKILAFALVSLLLWSCDRSDPDKRASIRIDGQTEYNLSDKADAISINVVCNSSWSYDLGGADWLKESKRGDSFLLLTLAENKTTEERTATVKFQAPASGTARAEATVTVKQAGKEVPVTLELSDYGPITVPAISTVPVSITVKSSCGQWEYDIEGAPAWIKAGKSDGALSLEIAENKVDEDRKATISFYAPTKQAAKAECHVSLKQEAAATPDTPEDLSVSGTANSYLIAHSGYYCFDATVRGNGKAVEGLSEPAGITAEGASLVWQSQPGMISKVTYKDGKISFRVSDKTGNAVIAAVDADGNIAWSWHIWYPKAAPKGLGSSTGAVVMEYNLGALTKAVEKTGDILGIPDYSVKVFLTILHTQVSYGDHPDKFGGFDGEELDMSKLGDRIKAIKWCIDTQISLFKEKATPTSFSAASIGLRKS